MKKLVSLKITSRELAKDTAENWADHVISVVDLGVDIKFPGINHCIEHFEDVIQQSHPHAPTKAQIESILKVTDKFLTGDNIVIHCEGGVCRSTAIAVLIECQAGFTPIEAIQRVQLKRPQLWPNELVIALGDEILGLNDELVIALEAFMNEQCTELVI